MPVCSSEKSSDLVVRAEQILTAIRILDNSYFDALGSGRMSRDAFSRSQRQFYFAVDFFSRPMSALLMRIPCPKQRLGILANVVEEHGDFQPSAFHVATFREFLEAFDDSGCPRRTEMGPQVHAFNAAIMAACMADETQVGIACLGIIEYAFADISACIGKAVVERGWLTENELVHYSLHAEIDKKHAADFFKLIEDDWREPTTRPLIEQGLQLGAYVFDRLYRDLMDLPE